MKLSDPISLAVALIAANTPVPGLADTLRCGRDFAELGETRAAVLKKCGEPARKESSCVSAYKPVAPRGKAGKQDMAYVLPCVTVDEWTYKPGSGQFLTTLRFENGELKSITYGDRIP